MGIPSVKEQSGNSCCRQVHCAASKKPDEVLRSIKICYFQCHHAVCCSCTKCIINDICRVQSQVQPAVHTSLCVERLSKVESFSFCVHQKNNPTNLQSTCVFIVIAQGAIVTSYLSEVISTFRLVKCLTQRSCLTPEVGLEDRVSLDNSADRLN
jgi:hypothetical protein